MNRRLSKTTLTSDTFPYIIHLVSGVHEITWQTWKQRSRW